ncbi:MAG: hypothetical protein RBU25_13845 [Lentisphaeria bacterium]|jgi:hypothetical protein|nr:hypothetical protein [Lentisphaeria bacterium]
MNKTRPSSPPPPAGMSNDPTRQIAALRQAVLLLAFLVAFAALCISLLRGSDLLHAAFAALVVLPIAAAVIHQVFRLWFLVLINTIREKRLAQQQAELEQAQAENRKS